MKRSYVSLICLVLLLSMCGTVLMSCSEKPESAYDIAVKHGYVGSEADWLASLKGQDLQILDIYEHAKSEGFTGDFLSFLTEYLGLDADQVAEAILAFEAKDLSQIAAYPLLSSVSIQCSSSGVSGTETKPSSGSGVIYSLDKGKGDAYIITNQHVVAYTDGASQRKIHQSISVFLWGYDLTSSNIIRASYVGGSDTYDIAVLKISASSLLQKSNALPISVKNSDDVVMGETTLAIGNAAGQGISVTTGAVSMTSKEVQMGGVTQRLMQIEAPVNEGNSGGGLFNQYGDLIGIVSSKTEADGIENMGYAIPSNIAIGVAENIIDAYEKKGASTSVSLKVANFGIQLESGNAYGAYDDEQGVAVIREYVTIDSVQLLSPARLAGLKSGDILISIEIDGVKRNIQRDYSLIDAQLLAREESSITLIYLRDDVTRSVTFTTPSTCFEMIP